MLQVFIVILLPKSVNHYIVSCCQDTDIYVIISCSMSDNCVSSFILMKPQNQ